MTANRTFQSIWILTDGKIGDLVQCRGIARHLVRGAEATTTVSERLVHPTGMWAWPLPYLPVSPADTPDSPDSPIAPPFPDLVLASGRRTLPYLRLLKKHAPKTAIVFLKDPRVGGRGAADFIWAPVHDHLPSGKAVTLSTHTSPHGLDEDVMAQATARAEARFATLRSHSDGPVTGLILGGNSGTVSWTAKMGKDLAKKLKSALPAKGVLLITPSRRTPPALLGAVQSALPPGSNTWYDDGAENAYKHILAYADRLIVTGDSHNMVSEALSTGSPVYVYRPKGLQQKLQKFLDAMLEQGAIRNFDGALETFAGIKLDATAEIARKLEEQLS
ncbi:MAG: mitochondrial fission ELM1 family protein [Pseudomonadota bacterium]